MTTPETRDEVITRWERDGLMSPDCPTCQQYVYTYAGMPWEVMCPPHKASARCESGKRPHCTCDRCF